MKFLIFTLMIFFSCNSGDLMNKENKVLTVPKVIESVDSFYILKNPNRSLFILQNNSEIKLFEPSADYMAIEKIEDFDKNGFNDVFFYTGSLGTCCPESSFHLILNYGNGYIKHIKDFHYGYFNNIEMWQDKISILIDDDYEGSTRYRYFVENGNIKLANKMEAIKYNPIVDFSTDNFEDAYQREFILYDIDNDGISDTISGALNYRWNLNMSVYSSSESSYLKFKNCYSDRYYSLGILSNTLLFSVSQI